MTEPAPRYGTRKAIDELSEELNLPNEEWMQDWPFEVVKADDIEQYIAHYRTLADEDKKFLLMEAIIQAATEQREKEDLEKYWKITRELLLENFPIHVYSIFDWCCFDSDDVNDCWAITPKMRELWNEKQE